MTRSLLDYTAMERGLLETIHKDDLERWKTIFGNAPPGGGLIGQVVPVAAVLPTPEAPTPEAPTPDAPKRDMGWGEYISNLASQAASGLTLGYADELASGGNAGVEWLWNQVSGGPDTSIGAIYDRNLTDWRTKDAAFAEQYPIAATTANIVGGLASAAAAAPVGVGAATARALPTIARAAGLGAAAGGVAGFGTGEGGFVNRLQSAGEGAAAGGVVGGAVGALAPKVGTLLARTAPDDTAALAPRTPAGPVTAPPQSSGDQAVRPFLHDPPSLRERPFVKDYTPEKFPDGPPVDKSGRLTHDMDGRELHARHIAGRQTAGGRDEGVMFNSVSAIGTRLTGKEPRSVPASELPPGTVGSHHRGEAGHPDKGIKYLRGLPLAEAVRVISHEVGHAIDRSVGDIPMKGLAGEDLSKELTGMYHVLRTGEKFAGQPKGPKDLGYSDDKVRPELMAEALRAYMFDPNFVKTVAPLTAARLRAAVNDHPELSRLLQLNSLLGVSAADLPGFPGGAPARQGAEDE